MTRWDETNFDNFGCKNTSDHEEARLLKKFDDYRDLEKRELEKRNNPEKNQKEKKGYKRNRLFFLSLIQATIVVGITVTLIFFEFINSEFMNLVLVAALVVLAGEIVIISTYNRKKSVLKNEKAIEQKTKDEFDYI